MSMNAEYLARKNTVFPTFHFCGHTSSTYLRNNKSAWYGIESITWCSPQDQMYKDSPRSVAVNQRGHYDAVRAIKSKVNEPEEQL
jgi:hypothetical protein